MKTTENNILKEVKLGDTTFKVHSTLPKVVIELRVKKIVPVAVYNLDGKYMYVCESIEAAAEKTKISPHSIRRAINPRYVKVHVRKFQFAHVEDSLLVDLDKSSQN